MVLKLVSLISTVGMLFSMGLLMFATPPLLVLKHDTPRDSLFIRGVFNLFYNASIAAGIAATIAFAISGNIGISASLGAVTVLSLLVRNTILGRMDALRTRLAEGDQGAVSPFRRTHVYAMGVNLAQLAAVVCCLFAIRF